MDDSEIPEDIMQAAHDFALEWAMPEAERGCEIAFARALMAEREMHKEPALGFRAMLHMMHQVADHASNGEMDKAKAVSGAIAIMERYMPDARVVIDDWYGDKPEAIRNGEGER